MMLLSRVPGIGPVGPWSTGGGFSSSTPVGVPQPGQNRACAGSSVPQLVQNATHEDSRLAETGSSAAADLEST